MQRTRLAVARHVSLLRKHRPNAGLAFVFTKADDYGIAGPTRFRMIDTQDRLKAFERWARGVNSNLDEFIAALVTPPDDASLAIREIVTRGEGMLRDLIQLSGMKRVNA